MFTLVRQYRFGLAAAAAAMVVLSGQAASARTSIAAPPDLVIGVRGLAGLSLSSNFDGAARYFKAKGFGSPRMVFDEAGCTLSYPAIDLRLWYLPDDALAKGTPATCEHFHAAVAGGSGWHTRNGLRIGDSTARLRALFPHAYDTRHRGPTWGSPVGSVQWDITITSGGGGERPALLAMVSRGRLVALLVEMVGH